MKLLDDLAKLDFSRGYDAGLRQGMKLGYVTALASRVMWVLVGAIVYAIFKAV